MRITEKYILFYKEWPGNYTRCSFTWTFKNETNRFFCTEQAFMFAKSITFNDIKCANLILDSNNPNECRLLGRKVKNYNDSKWDELRYNIMYSCNKAKYDQNENLKIKLLNPDYYGKTFVEASPIDGIWGIRMSENDPGVEDCTNWKGRNLLGNILTDIRNLYISERKEI